MTGIGRVRGRERGGGSERHEARGSAVGALV